MRSGGRPARCASLKGATREDWRPTSGSIPALRGLRGNCGRESSTSRYDDALLPTDGPVVELILSALNVADEVGCGPSEALGLLDRAHCRVVCGLMQIVPRRHAILPGLDLNDRLAELLGVVVGRSEEAAAFLQEQMAAQMSRYDELRAEALTRAADAQRTVVEMCRRARELAQPAASILDDLQEQVEARFRAHWMAADVAVLHSSLESKLNDLRATA